MKATRRTVQSLFLMLTLIGVFWVGANAERWCPFGGVEALYTYLDEGNLVCSLAVSNFYILGAVLLSALLLRRAFCGYLCPIGTLSEWLQKGAARLGARPARIPRSLDRGLSLLKYAVLAVILFLTWQAGELIFRGFDPCYALLSRHGEDITFWAYVVAGAIAIASLIITVPFCRWLCPLAALLNPLSRFGLTRIQRNPETCTSCLKCARACPMAIPVDEAKEIKNARCTSCLECMAACPEQEKGVLSWTLPGAAHQRALPQAVLVGALLLIMTAAVSASYLFPLPSFVWTRGEAPPETATLSLKIENLGCRGNATLLTYYLDRDDELGVQGYIRLEAWPQPGPADARIIFDPARAGEARIKMAVTEAYFDHDAGIWRPSPFKIQGYDPLRF